MGEDRPVARATKKSHATAAIAGRRGATARLLPRDGPGAPRLLEGCGLRALAHRHRPPPPCPLLIHIIGCDRRRHGRRRDRWSRGPREGPRDFGDRGPPRRGFEERGPPREGGDDRWSASRGAKDSRAATARLLPAMDLVRAPPRSHAACRPRAPPEPTPPRPDQSHHRCVTAAGTGGGDDRWSRGPREGPRDFGDRGPPRRGFEERGPPRESAATIAGPGGRVRERAIWATGARPVVRSTIVGRRAAWVTEGQGGGSSWRRA